jgi:hypothetical protein
MAVSYVLFYCVKCSFWIFQNLSLSLLCAVPNSYLKERHFTPIQFCKTSLLVSSQLWKKPFPTSTLFIWFSMLEVSQKIFWYSEDCRLRNMNIFLWLKFFYSKTYNIKQKKLICFIIMDLRKSINSFFFPFYD